MSTFPPGWDCVRRLGEAVLISKLFSRIDAFQILLSRDRRGWKSAERKRWSGWGSQQVFIYSCCKSSTVDLCFSRYPKM
ncbi:uncharacterized protein [Narcine bancroftii]|uniref:uncharacterized protein isoform X6 n=1 Tax=Narcine bancroftii TaxID=1343680 RepID=UPI0038317B15